MTFDQIKELHDMGFSPEQITELSKITIPSETIPEGNPAGDGPGFPDPANPAPADIEETQPAPEPVTAPAVESDIIKEIRDLKASIQANNIKMISVDNVKPEDTLENVMAEFIRPSYKKEDD